MTEELTTNSRYDKLRQLRNNGDLKFLLSFGLISYKPLFYLDIYEEFDKLLKLGNTKTMAIDLICVKFKIKSYTTVYNIIKFFENDKSGSPNSNSKQRKVFKSR